MKILSVREHEAIAIGEESESSLSERDAALLERLRPSLPAGALSWERRRVRFGHVCGLIRLGGTLIEILPKIYGREHDPGSARAAVIRMLEAAGEISVRNIGAGATDLQELHLLDLLAAEFCDRIFDCLRRGAVKSYVERQETLSAVRGRIDVAQLARRTRHEGTPCRFQEFSEDNPHNRILKDVLRRLLPTLRSPSVRGRVNDLLLRFADIPRQAATAAEADRLAFDRATRHWEPVFRQCSWFLRGLHPDVFSGPEQGACLVFDMNRLFESFTTVAIRKALSRNRDVRLHMQGPQRFLARDPSGAGAFRMRPDMVGMDATGRTLFIADAKWKRLDASGRNASGSMSAADVYQVFAYARRYHATEVALIYPAQAALDPAQELAFRMEVDGVRLRAIGLDLLRPHRADGSFQRFFEGVRHQAPGDPACV